MPLYRKLHDRKVSWGICTVRVSNNETICKRTLDRSLGCDHSAWPRAHSPRTNQSFPVNTHEPRRHFRANSGVFKIPRCETGKFLCSSVTPSAKITDWGWSFDRWRCQNAHPIRSKSIWLNVRYDLMLGGNITNQIRANFALLGTMLFLTQENPGTTHLKLPIINQTHIHEPINAPTGKEKAPLVASLFVNSWSMIQTIINTYNILLLFYIYIYIYQ